MVPNTVLKKQRRLLRGGGTSCTCLKITRENEEAMFFSDGEYAGFRRKDSMAYLGNKNEFNFLGILKL